MNNSTLLAQTWNSNESGTLWEAYWYHDKDIGYYKDSIANDTFNPRQLFKNETEFWRAYKKEAKMFSGSSSLPGEEKNSGQ